jgi:hypothetical protein
MVVAYLLYNSDLFRCSVKAVTLCTDGTKLACRVRSGSTLFSAQLMTCPERKFHYLMTLSAIKSEMRSSEVVLQVKTRCTRVRRDPLRSPSLGRKWICIRHTSATPCLEAHQSPSPYLTIIAFRPYPRRTDPTGSQHLSQPVRSSGFP